MSRNSIVRLFLGAVMLAIIILPFYSVAQITFERTYGDSLEDSGISVCQTSDGGYIVAGVAKSFSPGSKDIYLVRTDSLGDTLWTRAFWDSTLDQGNHVRQASDGGYIITGWTRHPDSANCHMYLLKVDSGGLPLWERTYGWDGFDQGSCVLQTHDGGYAVVGTAHIPGMSYNVYLVKTNANGNLSWDGLYGDNGGDFGRWVEQTPDSGYIIVGTRDTTDSSFSSTVYLIKTNEIGWRQWERTYGYPGKNEGYCVQETKDNGYIIVATTRSLFSADDDAYLIKTDSLGNVLWEKTYGGDGADNGYCVLQTTDGGHVVLGISWSYGAGSGDMWFFKTDSLGNELWSRTYGGTATDAGSEVWQTSDGGFILAGLTRSFGAGEGDVYLIKTDEHGLVGAGRDAAVLSLDSPPDTVFTDSLYAVTATVANFGNLTTTFDVITTIDGYADTVQVQDLDPGLSTQVTFQDWQAPSADSTSYTMSVCTHVPNDIDTTNDCMQKMIFAHNPIGVEEGLNRPPAHAFRLWQNEPNPFQRSTVIRYSLPTEHNVNLVVYDVAGRLVETMVNRPEGPGVFRVQWDRNGHADGIYFYCLQAGGFTETRKMVLVE